VIADADIERWEGVCRTIVADHYAPGMDFDDLLQEARIGAFKGVRDHRPERGGSLATFVAMCIRRAVWTAIKNATRGKHSPLNHSLRVLPSLEEGEEATPSVDLLRDPDTIEDVIGRRDELRRVVTTMHLCLSRIEFECMSAVAGGESYTEMAERMGVSVKRIDNAVQRARRKILRAGGES
jgi:RNA polymerase sporulation-specific sigma factor